MFTSLLLSLSVMWCWTWSVGGLIELWKSENKAEGHKSQTMLPGAEDIWWFKATLCRIWSFQDFGTLVPPSGTFGDSNAQWCDLMPRIWPGDAETEANIVKDAWSLKEYKNWLEHSSTVNAAAEKRSCYAPQSGSYSSHCGPFKILLLTAVVLCP